MSYQVSIDAHWSPLTHPEDFPPRPHFSPVIGALHRGDVQIWTEGVLASSGIELMAEEGKTYTLATEIERQVEAGSAERVILCGGINPSPGRLQITLPANSAFSHLTLVTMIAPSPDWFIGVSALPLQHNGAWVDQLSVDLYAYDAGSDDGITYTAANSDSVPKQFISPINGYPFAVNGQPKPLATFHLFRL